MIVYALIESKEGSSTNDQNIISYLYIKYSINDNKLWISDNKNAKATVKIGDIAKLVEEVQVIVTKIAKDTDFTVPNLFGGGTSIGDILGTLKFIHNESDTRIGMSLEVFGFVVDASVGSNTLQANVNLNSIFDNTTLSVVDDDSETHNDQNAHDKFIDVIKDDDKGFVSLDGVLKDFFYGDNGNLDDEAEKNGVIYDLVNTNAWRFDFYKDAEITIDKDDGKGGKTSESYRIKGDNNKSSFISFYFNKSDTSFSMTQLVNAFKGTDKQDGYKMLIELLNSMQLRAKLVIGKQVNGAKDYSDILFLDVAILRESVGSGAGTAKSRLYIKYDTSEADGRSGVLRATLSIDALQDVIQLKDALDKVLGGAITDIVRSVAETIADMQNNMPKLQFGNLARIFNSISYGSSTDGSVNKFAININGKALLDKLSDNIVLDVQQSIGKKEGNDHSLHVGNGLKINELTFGYGGFSMSLKDVDVTASPFYGDNPDDSTADTRTYDYLDHSINAYLYDNRASDNPSGNLSTTADFNKGNVAPLGSETGYDMSNYINLDSIYQLAASLVITAGNEDESGRRSFLIKGDANVDIVVGAEALANAHLVLNIIMYADIDENGDSYFAVKIHRDNVKLQVLGLGHNLYKDRGGDSYITFDTKSGNFNVYRDSYRDDIEVSEQQEEWYWWCPKCNAERPTKLCVWAWHNNSMQHLTRTVTKQVTKTGYESVLLGELGFKDENISPAEFMANLLGSDDANARCARGYLFEILNLGNPLSINIENIIKDQINNPDAKVFGVDYGVEDILDTGDAYNYGDATDNNGNAVANHKQFEIMANLSPVSSALGTLDIKIHHSGSFEDLMKWNEATGKYEYDTEKLAAIKLDRLCGGLKIANNIVTITFDLGHTTPGYGTAAYFTSDLSRLWGDAGAWTNGHKL